MFWQNKSLHEMSCDEWELLCDGCARCCLHKLEDEERGAVHYTSVVCQYLQQNTCRCTDYPNRHQLVPNCVDLTVENVQEFTWLPRSCAYRTLAEGRKLAWWHPLVSGNPDTVFAAGIAVTDKVIDERHVHPEDDEEHIIHWVEQ